MGSDVGQIFPTASLHGDHWISYALVCENEMSHPRGRNFNKGRGLPSPWLNSDPGGEISLSYMDRLMVDFFSHFSKVFCRNLKVQKT